jgi:hypothetical protein
MSENYFFFPGPISNPVRDRLAQDRPAAELADLLEGVICGDKSTSCPAQLALALRTALKVPKKTEARKAGAKPEQTKGERGKTKAAKTAGTSNRANTKAGVTTASVTKKTSVARKTKVTK